jgi:hypothetical protein
MTSWLQVSLTSVGQAGEKMEREVVTLNSSSKTRDRSSSSSSRQSGADRNRYIPVSFFCEEELFS